jgi:hypothetical protein
VSQDVRTGLAWSVLERRFDDITAAAYSVSLFTRFGDGIDQVWLKRRAGDEPAADLFGTLAASGTMHMLRGGSQDAVTTQGGAAGAWLDRLPHFRLGFTPSNGAELQSEYFVAREDALEAIARLRRIAPRFTALLEVTEIRTIAPDELWLSGAHRRDTVALHFTWVRDEPAVRAAVRQIEEVLVPLVARACALARDYEASARVGAGRLAFRQRWAVLSAAGIYGAIAREVEGLGAHAWDHRVRISGRRKAALVWQALVEARGAPAAAPVPRLSRRELAALARDAAPR